ncbi:hypothetical protein [Mycolicibacterium brisbanense]|uniref:Uncharacterized protein n=1 Tax=Mycolicibacterium brisbanense TaxID=146020 RepID=A0A117I7G4_9MYCO|nr:hypothetical protein [Mycolicibacterium brisbanense]MCV7157419.1 hypothetical protein [Mycolicibacterium brisbanense]GAS91534.1 uncharacterized protein RMCB_5630 [Mycolicibacterium brisbanense]
MEHHLPQAEAAAASTARPTRKQETSSLSTGYARTVPVSLMALQRTAGNLAVSRMLAGTSQTQVVQRADEGNPKTLDEAIKTGDSGSLKPFRPFPPINSQQLLSICNIVLTNAWVGPDDESTLEEAWKAYGHQPSMTQADYDMWKRCEDRGAEIHNVPWMKIMESDFAWATRDLADRNLENNAKHISDEAGRLGVAVDGGAPVAPSAAQDAAMTEQQQLAKRVTDLKESMQNLLKLDVGYAEGPVPVPAPETPTDSAPPAGAPGTQEQLRRHFTFKPGEKPPFTPEGNEQSPMANNDQVQAAYNGLEKAINRILNQNPALYALASIGGDVSGVSSGAPAAQGQPATQGHSLEEARVQIGGAFTKILDNIKETRANITTQSLGFQHLLPVHEKLYGSKYPNTFDREFLKAYVVDEKGSEESMKAALGFATMALIIAVEIGTGGAATPVIGALIGAASSSAVAANSWDQALQQGAASKTGFNDDSAVVSKEEANDAETTAALDTAAALLDVFMLGHAAMSGVAAARVAGLMAAEEVTAKLTRLSALSAEERVTVVSQAIERDGVGSVVARSGQKAEDLLTIVGKDTAAGRSINAFIAAGGAKSADDVGAALAKLATLAPTDADQALSQGIEVLGPAKTIERAGGWATVESKAVNTASVRRLENWRSDVVDDLQGFMRQRRASAASSTAAEDVEAARNFLGSRAGIGGGAADEILGLALGEMATMEKTARLAVGVKKFFLEPADARTRLNALVGIVNPVLEEKGIPAAMAIFDNKGYMAFDKGPWNVEVLGKLLAKERLTDAEFEDVVSCVYHEARHAEQFWMMARMKAAEGLEPIELVNELRIPRMVADQAVNEPLAAGSAESKAAREWYESIFGAGAGERKRIYQEMDDATARWQKLNAQLDELLGRKPPASKQLIEIAEKEMNDARDAAFGWEQRYKTLPEERDAYAVQARFDPVMKQVNAESDALRARADAAVLPAPDSGPPTVRQGRGAQGAEPSELPSGPASDQAPTLRDGPDSKQPATEPMGPLTDKSPPPEMPESDDAPTLRKP